MIGHYIELVCFNKGQSGKCKTCSPRIEQVYNSAVQRLIITILTDISPLATLKGLWFKGGAFTRNITSVLVIFHSQRTFPVAKPG